VDSDREKVAGYLTGGGAVVVPGSVRTATDGTVALDLVPNASIDPDNTYYLVQAAGQGWLIEKGAGTETLLEALAGRRFGVLALKLRTDQLQHLAVGHDPSPRRMAAAQEINASFCDISQQYGV
jgi:hypothetical protein